MFVKLIYYLVRELMYFFQKEAEKMPYCSVEILYLQKCENLLTEGGFSKEG